MGSGAKTLTLKDTLPDGVTLESLTLTGWGNLNMALTVADGTITGTDNTNQYNVSGTVVNNVVTLNVTRPTEDKAIQTNAEFVLTVVCRVTDAESLTESKTFTNTAEMLVDGVSRGSASQTQEWTYYKQETVTKVVDKSGDWDNINRVMNYSIILNPEGKELVEGADTLTLVDKMTYTNQVNLYYPISATYSISADLIQSSVKLYYAVLNEGTGEWEKGEAVSGWSWTYETNLVNQYTVDNTITATDIPDGMPLMFEYEYRVSSNAPDKEFDNSGTEHNVEFNLMFTNTAKLEGRTELGDTITSDSKWEYAGQSAGVSTDKKTFTFYKVEAGNFNVSVADAEFSVYRYDTSTNEYGSEPVKTYFTDQNGIFRIAFEEKEGGTVVFSYDANTLYKVYETAAPDGYLTPDEEKAFYFYFSSTEDTAHQLPENMPSDAFDLSQDAQTKYVTNEKIPTTEIRVEKKWFDASGNDITGEKTGTVTFDLYRHIGLGGGQTGSDEGETVKFEFYGNSGKKEELKGDYKNLSIGSEVQITIAMNFKITWGDPTVGITGINTSDDLTWDHTENSTLTFAGEVTGNIDISIDYPNSDFSVVVKKLSDPSSEGDTSTDNGNSSKPEVSAEDLKMDTVTLSTGNWTWSRSDLPVTGVDEAGNTVSYTYYVVETSTGNYTIKYENNYSASGTIKIINTLSDTPETPSYELPETGSSGTSLFTMGGAALAALSLLLGTRQRRRGERRVRH